jgi:hypothetical protein
MKNPVRNCSFIFCVLLSALPLCAQSEVESLKFDSSRVNARIPSPQSLAPFLADKDFLYDREPPPAVTFWQKIKEWFWEQVRRFLFAPGSAVFWRLLAYVFVAVTLIFVIAKLVGADVRGWLYKPGGRSLGEAQALAENIHTVDFGRLIDEAIQQRRHRLAVRLSYLVVLKRLTDQGLIEWKLGKTNHEYLRELKKPELRPDFAKIISLFEHIWYGEFAVNETAFERALQSFRNFNLRLAER